jgi:tetratricopeptide (TPR) repeat protein
MQGRKAETLEATRQARAVISDDLLMEMPGSDWYIAETYASMVRFGMWDELLAESAPNPKLKALTDGYHYGRVMALAAKGRTDAAKTELAELEKMISVITADDSAGLNTAGDVLAVAILVGKARIADAEQRSGEAIVLLTEAAAKEDGLAYDEPSDWFFPVRHALGAALLRAGKAQEAEDVYREDLRRHPENGWALYGLTQSLTAQHKDAEAKAVRQRFDKAWQSADITLTASAF